MTFERNISYRIDNERVVIKYEATLIVMPSELTGRGTYSNIMEAERVQSNGHSGETALPTYQLSGLRHET